MTTAMESLEDRIISSCLDDNDAFLKQLLGIGTSWDLIAKPFVFDEIRMTAYTANGYFLTMNMVLILEDLAACIRLFVSRQQTPFTVEDLVAFLQVTIQFVQVQVIDVMKDAVRFILSGPLVVFLDGYEKVLLIDTRIYPMRSIEEPEIERIVRGPKDGFTETMLMNVVLIRRRLRDPRLRVELLQVGTRSQTDVSLIYLEDVTNSSLVDFMRDKLKALNTDTTAMGEQTVTEYLAHVTWNPLPIARYTERPDVAVTGLLEGQVVIVVDTTPEVIIAPTTVFHHMHHPEDYHVYPANGTYLRMVMLFGLVASVFSPSLFILLAGLGSHLPKDLAMIMSPKPLPLPLGLQFILAQVSVDLFERAVINTPTPMATAIAVVAGLVFGQFAVMMNLITPEVLVFMGAAVIAQFATSSRELAAANRLFRFVLIVLTWLFGWIGYGLGSLGIIILVITTKSFCVPYFWPVIPFDWEGIKGVFIRGTLTREDRRSTIFHAKTPSKKG